MSTQGINDLQLSPSGLIDKMNYYHPLVTHSPIEVRKRKAEHSRSDLRYFVMIFFALYFLDLLKFENLILKKKL